MKKTILFLSLFLILLGSLVFYSYNKEKGKEINDFLVVDIGFIDSPRLYTTSSTKIKLIDEKTNQEIKAYSNYLVYDDYLDYIFMIKEGEYNLEITYNNKIINKKIEKQDGKRIDYTVMLNQAPEIKYLDNFIRIFGFSNFIFNFFIFFIFFYKKGKIGLLLKLIFCHLLIFDFLSFTNLFDMYQLIIFQIILEVSLISVLMIYFSYYLKRKNKEASKKKSNYVLIILVLLIVYLLITCIVSTNVNLVLYLAKYQLTILNFMLIVFTIVNSILNYSYFIIAYIILVDKFINTTNKDFRRLKIYQILFLTLVLILSLIEPVLGMEYYLKYDVLLLINTTILFWILFFEVNIEDTIKIYKKYKKLFSYILKTLIVFSFLYVYVIYIEDYRKLIPILLIYISGEILYYFINRVNSKESINYKSLFEKLKGINNVEDFEYNMEKEIFKKIPLKSIEFKIFLNSEEEKEYVKVPNDDNIIKKGNLQEKYKKYDFGIKISIEKNSCIAILLVENKEEKYMREIMLTLSVLLDDFIYIINYVRILSLRNTFEKNSEKKNLNEIMEEDLAFIGEFALLIKSKAKEEKIKIYSGVILDKVKNLVDKLG